MRLYDAAIAVLAGVGLLALVSLVFALCAFLGHLVVDGCSP